MCACTVFWDGLASRSGCIPPLTPSVPRLHINYDPDQDKALAKHEGMSDQVFKFLNVCAFPCILFKDIYGGLHWVLPNEQNIMITIKQRFHRASKCLEKFVTSLNSEIWTCKPGENSAWSSPSAWCQQGDQPREYIESSAKQPATYTGISRLCNSYTSATDCDNTTQAGMWYHWRDEFPHFVEINLNLSDRVFCVCMS